MQIFDFEGQQTRVVMIDGAPWWVAKDICDILRLTNPTKSIKKLEDDEHFALTNIQCKSFGFEHANTGVNLINESGLYTLIMRSNKPEAKKFRKWVTSEVLPSIRKHGAYITPQKIDQLSDNPDMLKTLIQSLKNEQDSLILERDKPDLACEIFES